MLANPRRRRKHRRSHRRRNPDFGGIFKQVLDPIKTHALGAAAATAIDAYAVNPLLENLLAGQNPYVKGAVKIAAYPLIGALVGKFLPGKVSGIVKSACLFGMAFGIKDVVGRVLGTPECAMKDLGYLYSSGTGYLSPGMGYLSPGYGNAVPGVQGLNDVSGFSMYTAEQV